MAKEEDDLLAEAREQFKECAEAESDDRKTAVEDVRFARLGEQWPDKIAKGRELEGRPSLVINTLPAFLRQVVNDARQNKPSIKVHPVDDGADPETAEVINGLIRNIEYTSNADVAYDTATESATGGGFGYWRIGADYSYDDSFEMDLSIKRIRNPFSVYGDPYSTEADSCDWDVTFIVNRLSQGQWERKHGKKAKVAWADEDSWGGDPWRDTDGCLEAEWWKREEIDREIELYLNHVTGQPLVLEKGAIEKDEDLMALASVGALEFKASREAKSWRVTQRIMSGAEILETRKWPGKYIPIVPVYGDEFDIEGKVYRRSLINNAKDPSRERNYWRSYAAEMIALAPKAPYIGPAGFAKSDDRWETVNSASHPYLEYDGAQPPARQFADTTAGASAMRQAMQASDDIKATMGLFDASLGQKSNETSGRAIIARQREGDVATFHFIDNKTRAIRHTGRILIDLIPHFYDKERIVRVIGEDGKQTPVKVNGPYEKTGEDGQPMKDEMGQAITALHDLTVGKYDLVVTSGPSVTTQRLESVNAITEIIRAYPPAAPILAPELLKKMDWSGADKIAEKLEAQSSGQLPPEVTKLIEEGKAKIAEQEQQIQQLTMDRAVDQEKLQADIQAERAKADAEFQIEQIRIASNERIANAKIESEARIAAYKAKLSAEAEARRPIVQPKAA